MALEPEWRVAAPGLESQPVSPLAVLASPWLLAP
jgi:hypothetical protein